MHQGCVFGDFCFVLGDDRCVVPNMFLTRVLSSNFYGFHFECFWPSLAIVLQEPHGNATVDAFELFVTVRKLYDEFAAGSSTVLLLTIRNLRFSFQDLLEIIGNVRRLKTLIASNSAHLVVRSG